MKLALAGLLLGNILLGTGKFCCIVLERSPPKPMIQTPSSDSPYFCLFARG